MTSISRSAFLAVVVGLGCVTSGGGNDDGSGHDDAVDRCHMACDHLKLFDCNDATAQAACYGDCDDANDDAIDLFVACVDNDVCDPACIGDLEGGLAEGGSDGGGTNGGGTTEGGGGTTEGGGGTTEDPVDACQGACDDLLFFHCITAQDQSDCRDLCTTAAADPRDTFTACVDAAAAGCTQPCWDVFRDAG